VKITHLKSRQIFDSRGLPTVETDLIIENEHFGRASVPSGASKGIFEAIELRDQKKEYHGKGVLIAVGKLNNEIKKKLIGKTFYSQKDLDEYLIELDGTDNKSNFGANTILSISIAFAKAEAKFKNKHLFESICFQKKYYLPKPMLNVINGGIHGDNGLDIQEFMIVPVKYSSIVANLKIACEVFHALKKILKGKSFRTNTGDEGGFAPEISSTQDALELIMESIMASGYQPGKDVCIALDVAANELYHDSKYVFQSHNTQLSNNDLVQYYEKLCDKYPIISIEDPFFEKDYEGWKLLNKNIGNKIHIVGDDLFVTNPQKINKRKNLANSILIKMNQIGTVSETLESIRVANRNGFVNIISHRSGETEDTTISHLAVATNSPFIKAGSISRTDRVCKYNELIRIEESILMSQNVTI